MRFDVSLIKREIKQIIPEVKKIRHYLHSNPELSLKEFNTSKFIKNKLSSFDINLLEPFLETDVVAILNGKDKGKNITLRADMDALPLTEENKGLSYRSNIESVMHACGHDGHTAMLLGTAIILSKLSSKFNGSVRFVFQPGEENVAAGKDLVEEGILKNPKPDAILAIHGWPGVPTGVICSKSGPIMGACDHFKIKIIGKGGHGSKPEECIDPILIGSKLVNRLYLIPSRDFRALDTITLSICNFHGGSSANVIPNTAFMEGTIRYFSKKTGEKIEFLLKKTVETECNLAGASFDIDYKRSYIPTVNNEKITNICKKAVKEYIGNSFWKQLEEPVLASEDFSYYIDKFPGAMFFLGLGKESSPLHSASFDFNDKALFNGILFFVISSLKLLDSEI